MKIEVRLNRKEFLRFSRFDMLCYRKIWRSPVIFAAILSVSASMCFLMHDVKGAVTLGVVLLLAGIGIPSAYFLNFFLSLRKNSLDNGLSTEKYVYTLELSKDNDAIIVENGHEHAVYSWEQVFHVYRNTNVSYLYITPQRAFLIPHNCVPDGADALWAFIGHKVPVDRQTVL